MTTNYSLDTVTLSDPIDLEIVVVGTTQEVCLRFVHRMTGHELMINTPCSVDHFRNALTAGVMANIERTKERGSREAGEDA